MGSAAGEEAGLEGGPPLGEVHVWHAVLGRGSGSAGDAALLAPDELARADGFAFPELARHWVWGRAALRRVLAGYLGGDPRAVVFAYGEHGMPRMAGTDLAFNLSHSGGRLVVAVGRAVAVGVDVERVSRCLEALPLARRFFAPAEAERLDARPADRRAEAFAALWSAKEAYAKALGSGLGVALRDCELAGELTRPGLVATAPGDPRRPGDWVLAQARPAPDYVCSLAVAAPRVGLVERRLPGGG